MPCLYMTPPALCCENQTVFFYLTGMFLISGSKIVNPFRFLEVFETWGPYVDGELIKEQAVTAFQKGHWQKEKPVLLGKRHTHTHNIKN